MFSKKALSRFRIGLLTVGLLAAAVVHGQVAPSAYKEGESLRLGVEFSNMQAGFPYGSDLRLSGMGVFGTLNWKYHLALDGDARFLRFTSYHGETENNILGGPRYTFLNNAKWRPYAAFKMGVVKITYPYSLGYCGCFALAPSGGLDYRINSKWSLRGEYQYQFLPDSPSFTNEAQYVMKPNGFSTGVSYRIF
jgi:hypothetical protein